MRTKEELRRLRRKKKKVRLTIDDAGTTIEHEAISIDAVPGWGEADVPDGLTKEAMLARSLDIALGLLHHERAMTVVDLADMVVTVWKVQANYTYGEFIEAARRDPRFQVPSGGLIAPADEPDPWGVLLERVEQEQARMEARRWCDD
jgi:hypothetical protein